MSTVVQLFEITGTMTKKCSEGEISTGFPKFYLMPEGNRTEESVAELAAQMMNADGDPTVVIDAKARLVVIEPNAPEPKYKLEFFCNDETDIHRSDRQIELVKLARNRMSQSFHDCSAIIYNTRKDEVDWEAGGNSRDGITIHTE